MISLPMILFLSAYLQEIYLKTRRYAALIICNSFIDVFWRILTNISNILRFFK